jgi:hypothetical protein
MTSGQKTPPFCPIRIEVILIDNMSKWSPNCSNFGLNIPKDFPFFKGLRSFLNILKRKKERELKACRACYTSGHL